MLRANFPDHKAKKQKEAATRQLTYWQEKHLPKISTEKAAAAFRRRYGISYEEAQERAKL